MTKLVCGSQGPSPQLFALAGGHHGPGSRSRELTPWCRGATRGISILPGSSWTTVLPWSILTDIGMERPNQEDSADNNHLITIACTSLIQAMVAVSEGAT